MFGAIWRAWMSFTWFAIALPERGVAMVVGAAVATILLVMMFIESVADREYGRRDVLVRLVGALWAIGAAILAARGFLDQLSLVTFA